MEAKCSLTEKFSLLNAYKVEPNSFDPPTACYKKKKKLRLCTPKCMLGRYLRYISP